MRLCIILGPRFNVVDLQDQILYLSFHSRKIFRRTRWPRWIQCWLGNWFHILSGKRKKENIGVRLSIGADSTSGQRRGWMYKVIWKLSTVWAKIFNMATKINCFMLNQRNNVESIPVSRVDVPPHSPQGLHPWWWDTVFTIDMHSQKWDIHSLSKGFCVDNKSWCSCSQQSKAHTLQ